MQTKRVKVPATAGARKLLAKLEALAARPGTPDEGAAAAQKLKRLLRKYDFSQIDVSKEFLFAGFYSPGKDAHPILTVPDAEVGYWVKWAIEDATKIECVFRGSQLFANAAPRTAERLTGIGRTIFDGFTTLWGQFKTFPSVFPEDRALFLRGLFDGMMSDEKQIGERLPDRVRPKLKKAKCRAVGRVAGIELHPYAVAVGLGSRIRFSAPLPEVSNQLEQMRPAQIAA